MRQQRLFLLLIWCIGRGFMDVVDYICRLSLSIHWRFKGLQWLCFRRWFMDQPLHNVFDNSVRQPWHYFSYRFHVSVMNSLTLSIPYSSCHLVFIDNFKFNRDSVLADNLWISCDIAFLKIPCVFPDSIFAINLKRRLWIHKRCQLRMSVVTHYSLTISRSTMTIFSPPICGLVVT